MGIAAVTAAAWLVAFATGQEQAAVMAGGFVPASFSSEDRGIALLLLSPLTATLVHDGPIHLVFNLLILLFCGRAVETIVGGKELFFLYLVGAYAAAGAHYLADPGSTNPMVGASGAISAVLGTYAILFGRNRVNVASPALATFINALWLAAAWIGLQLLVGFTFQTAGPRIAIFAHIGGFLAGLLLAKPLLLFHYRRA